MLKRYHECFPATPELPVPVESIAEDLLGLAVNESENLEVSGMLLPAERKIWLNASEPETRRRFTLAHELGHWVCQCLEGRTAPVYCRSDEVGVGQGRALEREANVFAAELLMPGAAVRGRHNGDVAVAGREFGVSVEAMAWRWFNLGLADDPPTPRFTVVPGR